MAGRVLGSNRGGRGGKGGGGGGQASSLSSFAAATATAATPASSAAPSSALLFSERLLHAHRPPLKRSSLSKFYASKSKSFSCMAALLDGEAPSGSWLLGKGKAAEVAAAAAAATGQQHQQPAPLSSFAEEQWGPSQAAACAIGGGGSCDFDCAEEDDLQLHLTTVVAGAGCCGLSSSPSSLMPLGRSSAPLAVGAPAPAPAAAAAPSGDDATPPPETPRPAELASQASLVSSGDGGGSKRGPVDMLCSALRGASLTAPAAPAAV